MKKEFTLDRVVRLLITAAFIVVGIYLLDKLSSVLIPFALAAIIAYILNPLVLLVQKKIKNRAAAVILSLLLVIGLFVGLGYILTPFITAEISQMSEYLSKYMSQEEVLNTQSEINQLLTKYISEEKLTYFFSEDKLVTISEKMWKYTEQLLTKSINVIFGILSIVSMIIYLVFILIDYKKIMYGWQKLIPNKFRGLLVLLVEDLKTGMNNYFRAQSLVAIIVGVLFAIGFTIIGLPLGIIFGLFVGLLNMIPYMQLASLPIAAFLALIQTFESDASYGWIITLVLIVYAVVQTIQDTLIVPKLMGKVTGLNAAVILLSLSVWGSLLGMLGMLIALPVTTIIYSYYQRYITNTEKEEQIRMF